MTTSVTLTSYILAPWNGTYETGDKIAYSADLFPSGISSDSYYVYRVDKNIIIGKEHKSELFEILQKLPDIFDVSEFKEASNLSRKYAIPYLEFLDKCLYTSKINSSGKRKKLV